MFVNQTRLVLFLPTHGKEVWFDNYGTHAFMLAETKTTYSVYKIRNVVRDPVS